DEIFESESGLLSIAGGKLTGYRKMAERIVDRLVKKIGDEKGTDFPECQTDKIILTGGLFKDGKQVKEYQTEVQRRIVGMGLDPYYAEYMVGNYGKQTEDIFRIF